MSEHQVHEHVVQVAACGKTIDEAISNGVAGLTDPLGHHASLTFDAFDVLKIIGAIAHKAGDHGTIGHVKVLLHAIGSHQD